MTGIGAMKVKPGGQNRAHVISLYHYYPVSKSSGKYESLVILPSYLLSITSNIL